VRDPELVAHADWSTDPRKRWMASASLGGGSRYLAREAVPVPDPGDLLDQLREPLPQDATVLLGFDFPIGIPRWYAHAAGVRCFRSWLPELGTGRWSGFYDVAERPEEISLRRPFYPRRPGGTSVPQLLEALGAEDRSQILRRCDRAHAGRPAASALFWTLGGKQVGKAALSGWRELLAPAASADAKSLGIWPFDGSLAHLVGSRQTVVAEAYPAEFYGHLGVCFPPARAGRRSGKRVQADRAANARVLLQGAREMGVDLTDTLCREIEDGFGNRADGEDRFDAVVGLLGMLNVLLGRRPSGEPEDEAVRSVEGWILGQTGAP
jgi:hypothetical protein